MQTNISLLPYNSLQVEAEAKYFLDIQSVSDLQNLPDGPIFALGQGCNTLFVKDYPGLVVKNNLLGREVLSVTDSEVVVKIASGEDWHQIVTWAVDNNWSGIENMAYIPGSVGAAVAGNIAAYGQALDSSLISVDAVEIKNAKPQTFTNKECEFRYRNSIFQDKYSGQFFITSAVLKLSKTAQFATNYYSRRESLQQELQKINPSGKYSVRDAYQAVINIRTQKLPDWQKIGTAGSFFKNPFVTKTKYQQLQSQVSQLQSYPTTGMDYPNEFTAESVKIPAGRLLEELGWKGKTIGRVATFAQHALVIINLGGATGQEIYEFAELMRGDVKKNFAIDLEYEVQIV